MNCPCETCPHPLGSDHCSVCRYDESNFPVVCAPEAARNAAASGARQNERGEG